MMLVSSVSIELKQILKNASVFFVCVSAQMQALLSFFFFMGGRQKGNTVLGVPSGDRGNWG